MLIYPGPLVKSKTRKRKTTLSLCFFQREEKLPSQNNKILTLDRLTT